MIVLNNTQIENVNGGIIPVGVAIMAAHAGQIAAPYARAFAYTVGGNFSYYWGNSAGSSSW